MPVMKSKNTIKSKSKPKSVCKGGVSNKVAPYNPPTSQRSQNKPSQSVLVSVVNKILNKSNSKVAVEKPRFGFSSNKK
jgi:hypothetical protein